MHSLAPMPVSRRRLQSGFTLVEALVALLVVSFGMLAIAGLHATLALSSDTSKQRSEAARLAQVKMEQLRSYDALAAGAGATFTYETDVVSGVTGGETITPANSNTAFNRGWTVKQSDGTTNALATDLEKWIHVTVSWSDRNGVTQSVLLDSVVARNNPLELKGFIGGQARPKVLYPKNRNLNIPYPAVTTSDRNRSAFIPPPGNVTFVFDNDSGKIIQSCTGISDLVEGIDLSSYSCTGINAYLLSGYVRFYDGATNPSASDAENTTYPTRDLLAGGPLQIVNSPSGKGPSTTSCYAQRQKVVKAPSVSPATISTAVRDTSGGGRVTITTTSNHGFAAGTRVAISEVLDYTFNGSFEIDTVPDNTHFTYLQPGSAASSSGGTVELIGQITLAETDTVPSGYTTTMSRFVSYACVVTPVDDDGDTSTPDAWWGELQLVPTTSGGDAPGWNNGLGTTYTSTNKRYKVCRYSGNYVDADGVTTGGSPWEASNAEHPRLYRQVSESLANQNFLVVRGDQPCPRDVLVNYATGDFVNSNTVPHQPTSEYSYQWNGTSNVTFEPTDSTTVIPMR